MQIAMINFRVSDIFKSGDCEKCPLKTYSNSELVFKCVLDYKKNNCPLTVGYYYPDDEDYVTD